MLPERNAATEPEDEETEDIFLSVLRTLDEIADDGEEEEDEG